MTDESQLTEEAFARVKHKLVELELPVNVAEELVADCLPVNYNKGKLIYRANSAPHFYFLVFRGIVKVRCPWPGRGSITLGLAGPGDIIGYAEVEGPNDRNSRIFEALAVTKCSVGLITREEILRVLSGLEKDRIIRLIEVLNSFWSGAMQRLLSFLSLSFEERLDLVLSEIGERLGLADCGDVVLPPRLTQIDIAEMIGSSRAIAGRLISTMIEDGRLRQQGKQYVLVNRSQSGLDVVRAMRS